MRNNYETTKQVCVVIVTWNGEQYLQKCLLSLGNQTYQPSNIIIVDNCSTDRTLELVSNFCKNAVIIKNQTNLGVAKSWNIGFSLCKQLNASFILFLNQDTELSSHCISSMIDVFSMEETVGVIGAKLLYPNSSLIQHAGGIIITPTCRTNHHGRFEPDRGQFDIMKEVDYVTGACFGIRTELLIQLNGAEEWFSPAYYEDVDICVRARKNGAKVIYNPSSVAIHYEHSSLESRPELRLLLKTKNRLRYAFKHLSLEILASQFFQNELNLFHNLKSKKEQGLFLIVYRDNWNDLSIHLSFHRTIIAKKILFNLNQSLSII